MATLFLATATTGEAGVWNNETWTQKIEVDKPVRVTGLRWYSIGTTTGTSITARSRIYTAADGILVGSGSDFTYIRTGAGWQPIVPLNLLQPVLLPGVLYNFGFWFGTGFTEVHTCLVPSSPRTVSSTDNGITYNFITRGRTYAAGDTAPLPSSGDTTYEMSYAMEFIDGNGQKLQMML